MRSDQDHSGKPARRNPSVPVPGMPYRMHSDLENETSADTRREFEFIESRPMSEQRGAAEDAYNPWEELGWEGGETLFPEQREPEVPQEEQYFRPMLDLDRELPDAYGGFEEFEEDEPYPPPEPVEPEYLEKQEIPPPPPPPKRARRFEPWRTTVVLCCVAGLLFCGVEIYRIAQNVIQSETELREYRAAYLRENNVDFSRNAQAVALRPPGETYPPTASPAPVQTPTPTPRIEQNDPLIAAMSSGGIGPGQSVAPGTEETAARNRLERYPLNPLLIIRDDIAALQAENPDIVGRLIINGVLNELVVLRNNTYYLNHNAMGVYSSYSAVFADENINFRVPPENILLYGRTSNEGKAFAPLKSYIDQGLDFAGRNAFLSFNTLYEEARYVIIAVIAASSNPDSPDFFDTQNLAFDTDEAMMRFAAEAMGRSRYIFNVGVVPSDRLLTLVTLSDGADSSSIVIVCRMLREGEQDGLIQQDNSVSP